MKTPATIGKHPIHPMLVTFPVGLLVFSLICEFIFILTRNEVWTTPAVFCLAAGIVGGIGAALPGFIDFLSLPASRARGIAGWHMCLNLLAIAIFIFALWLRLATEGYSSGPFLAELIGVGILGLSGWLGGSLVYIHGVAVQPDADVDKRP